MRKPLIIFSLLLGYVVFSGTTDAAKPVKLEQEIAQYKTQIKQAVTKKQKLKILSDMQSYLYARSPADANDDYHYVTGLKVAFTALDTRLLSKNGCTKVRQELAIGFNPHGRDVKTLPRYYQHADEVFRMICPN